MKQTALAVLLFGSLTAPVLALGPEDVYLVINRNVPESKALAEHYCARRKVPADHILALDLPRGEDIGRKDYDEKLAGPLRELLKDRRDKVKVLLTFYGVPLRVGSSQPSEEDRAKLAKLMERLAPLERDQRELDDLIKKTDEKLKKEPSEELKRELADMRQEREQLQKRIRPLDQQRRWLKHEESQAAVDSELALLWYPPYPLQRWVLNPLNFQAPAELRQEKQPLVMTCRIDGPDVLLLEKLIDTSVEVEKKGLAGKVYVDARGIKYDPKGDTGFGYGGYDESMREMARLLEKEAKMPVTLDDRSELFAPGSCPDAALYCGWYSLANYVDCCTFVPGAVAWHLASSEAVSLRDPKSKLWCKNLLEKGVVATLGPVAEPYTVGFPKPAEFFGFLATGEYTLVECYWRSEYYASWMTVLVGDPLYNPFGKRPKLKSEQVKPSPAGGNYRALLGGS
jgi:uncharacterized protein (TIGR03790 family)